MILLKSDREIAQMRKSGAIVAKILNEMCEMAKPGMSTGEIDVYAERRIAELGAQPAFKGYHGFPACVCISVNDEVVHGIPSRKRLLRDGDIVGIDFGVVFDGWYGDSARTVCVGRVAAEARALVEATQKSLEAGIAEVAAGKHVFDIGNAVQSYVEGCGYSVVREFVGHGIGRALHEDPQIPNYGPRGRGAVLKPGMVLAIEPMVNAGGPGVKVLADGWTAVTQDQSLSAHFEHTVAITSKGVEILTLP